MAERDGYIPGVPCWIDTSQPDPKAAADFYSGLFGWELEEMMPPGSEASYLVARLNGCDVAAISSARDDAGPPAWNTYVWVESADETASKVLDAGGAVTTAPFDVFDAGRMAVCADTEGAAFSLWEARKHRGARIVNEAGALTFNGLGTHDLDGAAAFYGATFGWRIFGLPGGSKAWILPGYGDYLEELTPGIRARTAEYGVPGFEDVVAAIGPIPDEEPDTRPSWNVTFSTDDADASAERAAGLGGQVVVPPFDEPFVRRSVIRDPQGASFIISQFVPDNTESSA